MRNKGCIESFPFYVSLIIILIIDHILFILINVSLSRGLMSHLKLPSRERDI